MIKISYSNPLFFKVVSAIVIVIFVATCAKQSSSLFHPTLVTPPIKYNYPCTSSNCKTVLSIGDSISIGYNVLLAPKINATYNLFHPGENCRNSWYTAQHIDEWIATTPHPDVIIWNNGIWNAGNKALASLPGNIPKQYGTSLDDYRDQLIEIGQKLVATGARVIFLTSTQLNPSTSVYFDYNKIDDLNQIAENVLPSIGVEVSDLHAISMKITDQHTDGIHYSSAGYDTLATFVKQTILKSQ